MILVKTHEIALQEESKKDHWHHVKLERVRCNHESNESYDAPGWTLPREAAPRIVT